VEVVSFALNTEEVTDVWNLGDVPRLRQDAVTFASDTAEDVDVRIQIHVPREYKEALTFARYEWSACLC
jgi:hypothetical protein